MNIAMTLYSKHWHGNKNQNKDDFEKIAFDKCKRSYERNGEQVYTFEDSSNLIFTYDNVQVSLF